MQTLGHRLTEILGNVRHEVPPWQRRYSWDEDNWETLWQSLVEVRAARAPAQHFLGALVFQRGKPGKGMIMRDRIIDGQQRLITLSIVLAAIERRLASYPSTPKRIRAIDAVGSLLRNPGAGPRDALKIVPYGADQSDFNAILEQAPGHDPSGSRLGRALLFYEARLSELDEKNLVALRDAMASRLYFAAVFLDDHDDANRIFRSLNEAGLTLAPTDHIRNSLFMSAGSRGDRLYIDYWLPLETALGAGDGLLSFLFAEQARQDHPPNTLRKIHLQRVYAERFTAVESLEDYLRALLGNGEVFKSVGVPDLLHKCNFPNPAKIDPYVRRLREWGSQPAEISVLDVLVRHRDGELQLSQVTAALQTIESFLVRRFLAGEKANLLSRIFTDLVAQFPSAGTYNARLRAALSHPGHGWPTKPEVQRSVAGVLNFYTQGSAPQRRYILKTLNAHVLGLNDLKRDEIDLDWPSDLTIEHIMPQKLDDGWRKTLEKERKKMGYRETVEELHAAHVNLLGNLTLARQGRNAQYANKGFDEKVALMNQQLPIRLNSALGVGPYKTWDIEAIRARGAQISDLACAIWYGPSGR